MSNKKDYIISLALFLIGIFSRLPLIEKMQSHWDGPQYSIAVVRYSLEQQTPAPPGYPLYITLGKLAYFLTNDPHIATLLVSVLFAGIGAVVFYFAGKIIFNRITGLIASLLYLSAPTFYYFSLTSYPYGITPSLAAAFFLIGYFILFKKKNHNILFGIIFSLIIGFRPQDIFFFLPFYIWVIFSLTKKILVKTLITSLFVFLIWFIPFVNFTTGSINKYLLISQSFAATGAIQAFSFNQLERYLISIIKGYYLTFGLAGTFIFYYLLICRDSFKQYLHNSLSPELVEGLHKGNPSTLPSLTRVRSGDKCISHIKSKAEKQHIIFFALWILPSFIFNLFIRSDHAGYQMIYLAGLNLLISYALWIMLRKHIKIMLAVVLILVLFNLQNFFRDRDPNYQIEYQPTTFHYSDIKKNDLKLGGKVVYIKNSFNPSSTLVITTPTLWRPIMYHLPDFLIYEFDGLTTGDPRFKNTRRDAKDWNYQEFKVEKFEFVIPEKINTLVLFDDNSQDWVKEKKEVINLPGKSSITTIKVKPGERYIYNLGEIKNLHNENI